MPVDRALRHAALILVAVLPASPALAAGVSGVHGQDALGGGIRWDANPRTTTSGFERSLVGGLRFGVQGGSYESFRNRFTWSILPTVAQFEKAITDAFAAWTVVDPASGLGTDLRFVPDLATPTATNANGTVNMAGAEIDLATSLDTGNWNVNDNVAQALTTTALQGSRVKLTSGRELYASSAIAGSDITFNNNDEAVYSLQGFRLLLTHEIGHTLGLTDVDVVAGPLGRFIDDNYDGTTANSARDTLNNSWAALVDVNDPGASRGLSLYTVNNANPGFDTVGVNILMESQGLGGQTGDATPLTNDDFGGRQFLYPFVASVPEPTALVALAATFGGLSRRRRSRGGNDSAHE